MNCPECKTKMRRRKNIQLQSPFVVGQPVCHKSSGYKCPKCGSIKLDVGYNPFSSKEEFNVYKELCLKK